MLGKLHLIALELADHHHGNEPTSVPWEDRNPTVVEENGDRTSFPPVTDKKNKKSQMQMYP